MDLATYQASFPGFPLDEDSIQSLGKLLVEREFLSDDIWQSIKSDHQDPAELVKAIASLDKITAKELARIEADILNVAFIDLEETNISHDTFKLIDLKLLKERKIIPIKINGQELLIGCVDPANTDQLTGPGMPQTLAMRPCKILIEQFENKLDQMSGEKSSKKKGHEKKRLGDILVESKFITEEQLGQSLKGAKAEKLRMGAYLVKQGMLTNKQLSIALSKQFNIPFIDLDESLVDPVLATLLPKKLCYEQILCPVKREEKKLVLAMTDPTDIITIDHVEMMTGMRVSPVVSSELSIISALGKLYGESIDSLADGIGDNFGGSDNESDHDNDLGEDDAPIIKLVNMILTQAVHLNVSDIHIEVYEHELRIRFRQDGTLKLHMTPTKAAHAGVVSRIKVMANLDIAETRRPQDGRIKLNMKSKKVDLRVSCIPCVWGEKVVMRICDQGNLKVNLSDLGFEPFVLETYMEGVNSPNGIVLVTGPTGSGKTTTLYSSLFLLNNPAVNIMTAEDPVEYNLMGINQVQCHPDIGLDFSAALRSFLRQDPDIIMLGEIRDFETASIAIKAALTGHLVISTLHTNDAPATVARLLNMGIDPFSLASSLRVVQAQRLVRKICPTCSQEYKPDKDLLLTLGVDQKLLKRLHIDKSIEELIFHKGVGCPDCDNIGTRGRMGIYEVLTMTDQMRILVESQASTEEMRRQALSDGMLSLRESALYKLIHGNTSVQEVFATTIDAGGAESPESTTSEKADDHKPKTKKSPASKTALTSVDSGSSPTSLGDFTREMHEFSSIISKITGTGSTQAVTTISNDLLKKNIADPLALIKAQAAKPDAADKLLPLVQAQGQKMEFNVKNLIAHFSDSVPVLKKIQLNQLIEREVFTKLKSQILTAKLLSGDTNTGKNLKISKNLPQNLPAVMIDPAIFSGVINNIFVNALLALGSKGGEIKVVTRPKPKAPGKIEFIIFDSGGGITSENQQKLFVPFKPLGRNTLGLGLSVAKKLVEQHNGKISIKCTADVSTLVTIELPAAS